MNDRTSNGWNASLSAHRGLPATTHIQAASHGAFTRGLHEAVKQ